MRRIYRVIGKFAPYKNSLKNILRYAGMQDINYLDFSGINIVLSAVLGLISFTACFFLLDLQIAIGAGIAAFVGIQLLVYVILVLVMDSRTRQIEEILADALQLMSANVRSGMTLDRAIWLSARPEFGPLEEEIKLFGREVLGGISMIDAFKNMKKRVNSKLLGRTLKLMEEGVKSGGEMAKLLDETAEDIRKIRMMRKEVKSNVIMYSMFIIFASVLGAPLLFAVSVYFIEMIGGFWSEQTTEMPQQMSSGIIKMTGPQISPDDMMLFSVACIILTTAFGSVIIGLIQTGKTKQGVKYMPLLMGTALGMFFLIKYVVSGLLGNFMGF